MHIQIHPLVSTRITLDAISLAELPGVTNIITVIIFSFSKDCGDHSHVKDALIFFLATLLGGSVAKITFFGLLLFLDCKSSSYLNRAVRNVACT